MTTADQVKSQAIACQFNIKWFGTTRALEPAQTQKAAETFDADAKLLSARKKIIDTKHAAWQAMTRLRTQATQYWKDITTPYPEPGLRLIKKDLIPSFVATMEQKRTALKDQVMNFDNNYYFNLRNDAEEKLGQLFNPEDYPPSLQGQFDISWEFHAVEPPIDLKTLYPAIYEQEQKKAQAKLEEAVTLAEQAFASELSAMLTHLTERLHAAPGEKKVFRDSAITNLAEFFDRFAKLKITNNAELDQIVKDAKIVLGGIEPQMLRDSPSLKKTIATEVGKLTQQLEGMIIKAPRRKIVIPDAQPEGSAA